MQQLTLCHDRVHTMKHPPLILFWFLTQACKHYFISLWLKPSIRDEEARDNITNCAGASTKEFRFWEEVLLICSWQTLFCRLHGWSFFVSLCHLFLLSQASLPVFNGWERQWRKEGRGRRTGGGRGLPSPGRALMKSLWSWVWLNSSRILRKRRGPAPLQGRPVVPFLFAFSSHLFPLDFLSLVCRFQARSSPPPSPCSYNRPSFHLLSSSLIRTWIMSLLN